jgi:hypothetical protein
MNKATTDRNGKTISQGSKVRILSGTAFVSTNPKQRSGVTERARTVTVRSIDQKYEDHTDYRGELVPARPAKITWAGTGSYWYDCNASDVEVLG